ncbi:MAG: STAS domain-containing protein [Acidimicrobiia bacterium]
MSEWDVVFERSERASRIRLAVTGEIDLAVTGRLRQELATLVDDSNGTGLVDLSGVGFIDSSGIRELLTARLAAQRAGGELTLLNPSASCRRVLEISGVLNEFVVQET